MANDTIRVRVRTSTGEVLIDQTLMTTDDEAQTELLGLIGGQVALDAIERGETVSLELMDPDGEITPAGEWIPVAFTDGFVYVDLYSGTVEFRM